MSNSSSASPGSNRRRPVHWKSQRRAIDPDRNEKRIAIRRLARIQAIKIAALHHAKNGDLSHEVVAAATNVPVEYLRWAYPTVEALAAVTEDDSEQIANTLEALDNRE